MAREKNLQGAFTFAWLVFSILTTIASTIISSVYHFNLIGWYAIGSIACYLALDMLIYWAEYIDYHIKDNGVLNWVNTICRVFGLAFLLTTGGIYFVLIVESSQNQISNNIAISNAKAFQNDRQLARNVLRDEQARISKEKNEREQDSLALRYAQFPMSKYAPGVIALFGLTILTIAWKTRGESYNAEEQKIVKPTFKRIASSSKNSIGFTANPVVATNKSEYIAKQQASGYRIYDRDGKVYITHIANGALQHSTLKDILIRKGL